MEQAEHLDAVWLGQRAFAEVLKLQLDTREALLAGDGRPTLFLVEHPPTVTIGRRGRREDILWPPEWLERNGIAVCETPRGGELTLHAPGQLVAYPVVRVGRHIRNHIVRLGEISRMLLGDLGLPQAEFRMEHPGLWLGARKLGSIGIHVSRGVTVQGCALNLDVDPGLFAALVSCGLRDGQVTSVVQVGGRSMPIGEAARRWAHHYAQAGRLELRWVPPP